VLLRLLPPRVIVQLEAGDSVVQTRILSAGRFFPAGEPALEPLDRLEGPRSLDLLPLLRRPGRSFALGRLEDPRE